MKKMGRKEKYSTHVQPRLDEIQKWSKSGLTEFEMCKRLGIARSVWHDYKNKYTDIADVIKEGRAIANFTVEKSLFKRATGYQYKETKVVVGDRDRTEITTREVAPDPASMIFWLKNRKPKDWKDKRDLDFTTDGENTTINVNIVDVKINE